MTFRAVTLFLVVCPVVIAAGLIYGIYEWSRSSVDAVAGIRAVYLFLGALIVAGVLMADRFLVGYINPLPLSVVEFVLLGSLVTYSAYTDRQFIVDLSENPSDYFFICMLKKGVAEEVSTYQFPFSRVLKVSHKLYTEIDADTEQRYDLRLQTASRWQGNQRRYIGLETDRYSGAWFCHSTDVEYTAAQVDSLKQAILKQE